MAIRITSKTKSLRLKPTSKGPDADLNFIDTSLITDMSMLFWRIKIGNIKIDQWDTSNVTKMIATFANQNFKCDLSEWDVSNVERYDAIFENCLNMTPELQPKFY